MAFPLKRVFITGAILGRFGLNAAILSKCPEHSFWAGLGRATRLTCASGASTSREGRLGVRFGPSHYREAGCIATRMRRIFKYLSLVVALLVAALAAYGGKGFYDANLASEDLRSQANELIKVGRGGADLGAERLQWLLRVQDPAYRTHSGVDFSTVGAGATTISQSVSKRLAFEHFQPGIGKVRQTGYALGLEQNLTKDQILALWLDTVEMGRGPQGWMTGFFEASAEVFGAPPSQVAEKEFLSLVAVLIAPSSFDLLRTDEELAARVERIERMIADECAPLDHGDVWLEGCRRTAS